MQFLAQIDQLSAMMGYISDQLAQSDLPKISLFNVQLVVEEVVVNIISYGYPQKEGNKTIDIDCFVDREHEQLTVRISDAGIAFNPLTASAEIPDLPLEQRKVGGLGIPLIRRLSDHCTYRREEGRNILEVAFSQATAKVN